MEQHVRLSSDTAAPCQPSRLEQCCTVNLIFAMAYSFAASQLQLLCCTLAAKCLLANFDRLEQLQVTKLVLHQGQSSFCMWSGVQWEMFLLCFDLTLSGYNTTTSASHVICSVSTDYNEYASYPNKSISPWVKLAARAVYVVCCSAFYARVQNAKSLAMVAP